MGKLLFDNQLNKVSEESSVGKYSMLPLGDSLKFKEYEYICSGLTSWKVTFANNDFIRSIAAKKIKRVNAEYLEYMIDIDYFKPKIIKDKKYMGALVLMWVGCDSKKVNKTSISYRDEKWNFSNSILFDFDPKDISSADRITQKEFDYVCSKYSN